MAVARGTTTTREGRQQDRTIISIGTMVQVSAEPLAEDVILKVKYESSRLGEGTSEEFALDIETVTFTSELFLEPGKTVVAAASTAQAATYLLISIVE